MTILLIIVIALILLFGVSLLFGAPYLPTKKSQIKTLIDLLEVKPGQTIYDLGSGDGKILKALAKKGAKVVGYEINPLLFIVGMIQCWKVRDLVEVHWGSYWRADLSRADSIYVFSIAKGMNKLNTKIVQEITKPVKLVSFAFELPNSKPIKQSNGLFLYKLPLN